MLFQEIMYELKIIIKSRQFLLFILVISLFLLIDSYYNTCVTLPSIIDGWLESCQATGSSIGSVAASELIKNLIIPVHPATSFFNSLAAYYTIGIMYFIVISSVLMGWEFKHNTIKVRLVYGSALRLLCIKLVALLFLVILFMGYTAILYWVVSLCLWPKITSSYSLLLSFLDLKCNSFAYLKEYILALIPMSCIILFYSTIAMFVTYYTRTAAMGSAMMLLPFFRFEFTLFKILVRPMDAYYFVMSVIVKNSSTPITSSLKTLREFIFTCAAVIAIEIVMFAVVKKRTLKV